jgi:hypothetical protein
MNDGESTACRREMHLNIPLVSRGLKLTYSRPGFRVSALHIEIIQKSAFSAFSSWINLGFTIDYRCDDERKTLELGRRLGIIA